MSETAALAPAATDWLRQELRVTGSAAEVARFAQAAAGPGVVPWRRDLDRLEEDWVHQLLTAGEGRPPIAPSGARVLARRLRDAVAAREARVLARAATADRACPFDLHRLLPVPAAILRLGPDDPESQAWLWAHWGTTRALRQVKAIDPKADRRQRNRGAWAVELWSADWSPWQALARLRRQWLDLAFTLSPDYGDEADG